MAVIDAPPSATASKLYENASPALDAPSKAAAAALEQAPGSSVSATTLAAKYRAELEETFDELRQRALKLPETAPQLLNETQAKIEPYKQEFVSTVQALDDVSTPPSVILKTLSWAAVLVLSSNISTYVSTYLLAPILSLAIGQFGALALALAAVPLYAYWTVQRDIVAGAQDVAIRFCLLVVALIEGLLVGFILQDSYLSGAPLAPLLLAITAVNYPFVAEKFGNNRQMLLGGSVGAAVGVTVVLGLLTGYLTLPYLVLTLLYGAITATCLQYIYKNVASDSAPTYMYQLALLVAFTAVNLSVHLIFGMNGEAYAQYKQSSSK